MGITPYGDWGKKENTKEELYLRSFACKRQWGKLGADTRQGMCVVGARGSETRRIAPW